MSKCYRCLILNKDCNYMTEMNQCTECLNFHRPCLIPQNPELVPSRRKFQNTKSSIKGGLYKEIFKKNHVDQKFFEKWANEVEQEENEELPDSKLMKEILKYASVKSQEDEKYILDRSLLLSISVLIEEYMKLQHQQLLSDSDQS